MDAYRLSLSKTLTIVEGSTSLIEGQEGKGEDEKTEEEVKQIKEERRRDIIEIIEGVTGNVLDTNNPDILDKLTRLFDLGNKWLDHEDLYLSSSGLPITKEEAEEIATEIQEYYQGKGYDVTARLHISKRDGSKFIIIDFEDFKEYKEDEDRLTLTPKRKTEIRMTATEIAQNILGDKLGDKLSRSYENIFEREPIGVHSRDNNNSLAVDIHIGEELDSEIYTGIMERVKVMLSEMGYQEGDVEIQYSSEYGFLLLSFNPKYRQPEQFESKQAPEIGNPRNEIEPQK